MSKFYTNIERKGNHIMYMGYENGLPIKAKIKYQPHLFVKANGKPTDYNTLQGVPVSRVDFDSMSALRDYVEQYKGVSNMSLYGCSDMIRQFTSQEFQGEVEWDYNKTRIWFFDIETRVEGIKRTDTDVYPCPEGQYTYSELMSFLDADQNPTVIDSGKEVKLKQSSYYVAGFPKPELAQQEILLISMVDHHANKVYLWSTNPIEDHNDAFVLDRVNSKMKLANPDEYETNHKHISEYDIVVKDFARDEVKMLKDFLMFWRNQRIDVIAGWNSEGFDIPYLVNRMTMLLGEKLTDFLSPWNYISERTYRDDFGNEKQTFVIAGITHLDYLDLYKKFNPGSQESFKLDFIAGIELGHGKKELPEDSFRDNYLKHFHKFVLYNIIDSHLLHQLESQIYQVRLAMQIAYYAKCNFGDVVSAMRVWESIIYNYFMHERNIVEDWTKKKGVKKQIVGAYVMEPKPGRYGWSMSFDFTSLYPSIMMQNNTSPEMVVGMLEDFFIDDMLDGKHIGQVPYGCIVSANGLITKKGEMGFIPLLVKRMFDLRKQTKNLMLEKKKELERLKNNGESYAEIESEIAALDVAQSSFKVASNSAYGILSMHHFRYYDPRIAEAITSSGQVFIKKSKEILDSIISRIVGESGEYVVYCDTDSSYIDIDKLVKKYCVGKSNPEIIDFVENLVKKVIQPELKKQLISFVSNIGVDEDSCKLDMKLENIGDSLLMVKKKKYSFNISYSEGVRYKEPKMKVMGIEIVRSSTPNAVKEYLTAGLKLCLLGTEKEFQSYVATIKPKFKQLNYTDASFPRGCNGLETYSDPIKIYQSGCPMHVRAALLYNHHLKAKGLDTKYPLISEGEKIKFIALDKRNPIHEDVIGFPAKLPEELDLVKYIDWNLQYEKAFMKPLTSIANAIGWSPTPQALPLDI